jgi:hypothetical protein
MNRFRNRRRTRRSVAPTTATVAGEPLDGGARGVNRRTFLAYTGVTGSIFVAGLRPAADPALAALPAPNAPTPEPPKSFTTVLRRPEDQLRVAIEFWNLEIDTTDGFGALEKTLPNRKAYLVYQFGSQHLAEEAFFIAGGNLDGAEQDDPPQPGGSSTETLKQAGQVRTRLAGGSRLAFEVPDSALPLTFSTASLLDWLPLQPRVTATALPRGAEPGSLAPRAPTETETAIEYPWRLQLSPHADSAWAHDHEAVDHGTGRYELWHTRLAVRGEDRDGNEIVDEEDEDNRTVRAVWATDPNFAQRVSSTDFTQPTDDYPPFRMSLAPEDRLDIVRLSTDWRLRTQSPPRLGRGNEPFMPEVVEVDKLMLSSLGGWLSSSFVNELVNDEIDGTYDTSLLQWNHIGAMGRDSYARVVRKGYLFPFGFKAALVTVTERRFERPPGLPFKPKGAYLRQRIFIVILKADRRFHPSLTTPDEGRGLPFPRLVCTTRITPDLELPVKYVQQIPGKSLFVPMVGAQPFRFQMRGFDWSGRPHTFDAPAVFVDDTIAYDPLHVEQYIGKYEEDAALNGARIAFAEETADRPGDTTFPTRSLRFRGVKPKGLIVPGTLARLGIPGFFPVLEQAEIALSDAASVAGRDVGVATVRPFQGYLDNGFAAPNLGEVFLEAVENAPTASLGVSTRNAGGMAAPALPVKSVSRILGPTGPAGGGGQSLVGGVADGSFDPAQILDDSVKILGGIALVEVLGAVGDFVTNREQALKITSTRAESPHRVITEVDWHPPLQAAPLFGPGLALLAPLPGATCDIHAEIVTNLDQADESSFRIDGEMRNFVVNLFGGTKEGEPDDAFTFVRVPFQRFTFRAGTMVAETMEPVLGDVTFHGPLRFLSTLADYMALVPGTGGNSVAALGEGGPHPATGPYLDVTATGIEAGIGLAIPEIGVGVMTLSNLSLAAGLRLPFDGSRVTLTFSFSSRDNPFSLTIWGLGGGGFAAMTLSIDGVEGMEFSLEFGAAIGISIGGLASGKVELKAGINFKIETVTDDNGRDIQQCTLTAYIRLHGSVDILGLIEVSLTFYVGLSFITNTGNLAGEATLTIEIDLVVFSESVELTVRKEIAGPGSSSGIASMSARGGSEPLALEPPRVTWSDLITQTDWEQYCTSFATVGA